MKNGELVCWRCGASIADLLQPLERIAACPSCRAELHVCRLCEFYNPKVSDKCNEPLAAGQVREVDRANFCDYFRPMMNAFQASDFSAADRARDELASLFAAGSGASNVSDNADKARSELDKLFGGDSDDD
jgi:hypothetical protein